MTGPTLYLSVADLCSKWGFGDGDEPDALLDHWDAVGVSYLHLDWHDVLRRLVRTHLVPAMEAAGHAVEVYDIETIHNPIRARTIDGVQVNDQQDWDGLDLAVTVAYADIMAAVHGEDVKPHDLG